MSEFLYKQKYLKYKNKYNELKNKYNTVDRLETENATNSIFLLSDTPTFNMSGGGPNEESYNLSETPTNDHMSGGDIDATPGNFTPNMPQVPCNGVVNPVVTPTVMTGGDINMTPGNFTSNVVYGDCPGVVNPITNVPISTLPVIALKQKGGDINSTPGNFPLTNVGNSNITVNPTGADLYSPFIQSAGPSGAMAALANPIAAVVSNKNLSINEQSYDTTTDISEAKKESESLSDIRNTADIDRLFKQLGGKSINREYNSSSSSSNSSSSIFSSSDSDSDILKKY